MISLSCTSAASVAHGGAVPLLVCGAGAAGLSAALSAARSGVPVYLVEARGQVGGTVVAALIHTLAGLYDSNGKLLQGGLAAELVDRLASRDSSVRQRRMGRVWVLSVCPNLYQRVVEQWIIGEPRITLLTNHRVSGVVCEAGSVVRVEVQGLDRKFSFEPGAVVDTTGTAEIVRMIDPNLLQATSGRSAAGLIFRMRGVEPGSLDFPRGLLVVQALRAAAAEGTLPATCDKAWIDTGVYEDEVFVKLFVPLPAEWPHGDSVGETMRQAHETQAAVVSFLGRIPRFARASVTQRGCLGVRDGGRVQGEYCLTGDDVRQMRKFEDAACRACWPIEYWDSAKGVSLEYLPDGDYYEIPLRSLKVRGLANVWIAGKCLAADPYAHASARVVGTCWAMGEAAGKAAAAAGCKIDERNLV